MELDADTVAATEADAATWTVAGRGSKRAQPSTSALDRGASVGRYVILEQLGAGGMGVVYAAYDPELDRKVAVKLVHDHRAGTDEGMSRLQREAQAMARLSHPNVISVHDVGRLGDRLFIAMEHVEGETLTSWLERSRPWTEALAAFARAGAGLAAAHAAGLVHRDFKPDNVLVGNDGRIRVLDFGLARAAEGEGEAEDDAEGERERLPTNPEFETLSSTLTAAGAIMGTPAYMAPEQHLGRRADARADQFAFCVALFEALFGYRPFLGDSYPELAMAVLSHQLEDPPESSEVPSAITELVTRGLARIPDDRHPSMDALLEALDVVLAAREGHRRPGRRVALAVALGLSVLGLGLAVDRGEDEVAVCAEATRALDSTWSGERRNALGRQLEGGGLDIRAQTAVVEAIDDYAAAWSAMSAGNCRATRVDAAQSDELMDLRVGCLERRRTELAAQLEVLETGEAVAVAEALASFEALTRVEVCAHTERLRQRVPAPDDPELRAAVETDEQRLALARAQLEAGLFADALASIDALADSPGVSAHVPLRAAHAQLRAQALAERGEYEAAESQLRLAALDAAEARDDRLLASILVDDFELVGTELGRVDEAMILDHAAQLALARIGGDEQLDRRRRFHLARTRRMAGEVERGVELLTALHAELDPDTPFGLRVTRSLAGLHANLGHYEQATALLDRSVERIEARFGPDHPELIAPLINRGAMYAQHGEIERSAEVHQRLLGLAERWYGPEHPTTGIVYESLGLMSYHGGDYAKGRVFVERAVAAYAAHYDVGQPDLVRARGNLSGILIELGEHQAAEALLLDSRARLVERFGSKHDYLIFIDNNLAELYQQTERLPAALEAIERARAVAVETLGPVNERVIECDLLAGTILRGLGRGDEARETLERALAMCDQTEASVVWRARIEANLGAVLMASPTTRVEGEALFAKAAERAEQAGAGGKPVIEDMRALAEELELEMAFHAGQ